MPPAALEAGRASAPALRAARIRSSLLCLMLPNGFSGDIPRNDLPSLSPKLKAGGFDVVDGRGGPARGRFLKEKLPDPGGDEIGCLRVHKSLRTQNSRREAQFLL